MILRGKILSSWENLRTSYWFLPTLMALLSIGASQVSLYYDRLSGAPILHSTFYYTGSAAGARSILSSIASSMISVAGVVFSMTLVTLSISSQQFGARTLRSLIRDRTNQLALGLFTSTFLFCILILRQVRGDDHSEGVFVPQISMLLALVLAASSIIVLIYFIHHIAYAIQAPHVIATAGENLAQAVSESASGDWVIDISDSEVDKIKQWPRWNLKSKSSGYIRRIDYQQLAAYAEQYGIVISVEKRSGDFVMKNETIFRILARDEFEKDVRIKHEQALVKTVNFGSQRTQEQDLRFTIGQLLSIALLALSPAINNPITAIQCIEHLGEGLKEFALRPPRGDFLIDKASRILVIDRSLTFEELFILSFREIRINAKKQLKVSLALLDVFRRMNEIIESPECREIIAQELQLVRAQISKSFGPVV